MPDAPTLERAARNQKTKPKVVTGRILLAEDDEEMRRLLASAMRKKRYEVVEVADGKELIDQISESILSGEPFDCVVTDVRMPRLTGTQALRFIKDAGIEVPVIVITAFGDNVTRVDVWLLGAAAVLDKPFEVEDLIEEIRKLREYDA